MKKVKIRTDLHRKARRPIKANDVIDVEFKEVR